MVLRVNYASQTLLLTGDLEGAGMDRVLHLPRFHVDVLMAPHHGSYRLNADGLVEWARPALIVSSQGAPRSPRAPPKVYKDYQGRFLTTHNEGAVTLRLHRTGMIVETFTTR
jgi:competence protein ComEC